MASSCSGRAGETFVVHTDVEGVETKRGLETPEANGINNGAMKRCGTEPRGTKRVRKPRETDEPRERKEPTGETA